MRISYDWGAESFAVALHVDPDRAYLAGVTNLDVAQSSAAALSGTRVGALREGKMTIPMWEPLCYAQIGGLTVATVITLILVPVLYAIFVLDLKLVKWTTVTPHEAETSDLPFAPRSATAG